MTLPPRLQSSNRLHLAHKDMEDVKRYLDAMRELLELQEARGTSEYFDHCEAILLSAMIAYCRPFKASRSTGHADKNLKPDDLDCLRTQPELRHLHDLIAMRRDKAIAHADWEMRSTEVLTIEHETAVHRRTPIPDLLSGITTLQFWNLAHSVSVECAQRSYDLDRNQSNDSAA